MKSARGFALPTVMITSLVMLSLLLMGLSAVSSTSAVLREQYVNKLAQEASEAGLSKANQCLAANGGEAQWANDRPLRPDTDCAGYAFSGLNCSTSPNDPRCYVLNEDIYRTSFEVRFTNDSEGIVSDLQSKGIVNKVRSGDGTVVSTSSETLKQRAGGELTEGGGGATQLTATILADVNDGMQTPWGITADNSGNVYAVQYGSNGRLYKITPSGVVTEVLEGLYYPMDVTADGTTPNPYLYVSDYYGSYYGSYLNRITPSGSATTVPVAFSGTKGFLADNNATESGGVNLYVRNGSYLQRLSGVSQGSSITNTFATGISDYQGGLALDEDGGRVFYTQYPDNRIYQAMISTGAKTVVAGSSSAGTADGTGTNARFTSPYGLAVDSQGNIYVADFGNQKIRKITMPGAEVTTLNIVDDEGDPLSFNDLVDVAIDNDNNLFVSDYGASRIYKIPLGGGGGETTTSLLLY